MKIKLKMLLREKNRKNVMNDKGEEEKRIKGEERSESDEERTDKDEERNERVENGGKSGENKERRDSEACCSTKGKDLECGRCAVQVKRAHLQLKCQDCACSFHLHCTGVSMQQHAILDSVQGLTWTCVVCRESVNDRRGDEKGITKVEEVKKVYVEKMVQRKKKINVGSDDEYEDVEGEGEEDEPAPCKICPVLVMGGHPALQCDMCDEWLHIECADVPPDLFEAMGKKKNMIWFCDGCSVEYRMKKDKDNKVEEQTSGQTEAEEIGRKIEDMKENIVKEMKECLPKLLKMEMEGLAVKVMKEVKQESHYKEALLKNMTRLETNQKDVVSKVAKEVVVESRISDYDRSLREKNVIIFDCVESNDDSKFMDGLFEYIDMRKGKLKLHRLGEKREGKVRPLKVTFEELTQKRKFLSLLYRLSEAPEQYKKINVQHDLSSKEREHLKSLLNKAKELNTKEDPKDFRYKVRGPPFAFEIRKIRNRPKRKVTDETNKESTNEPGNEESKN